MIVEICIDDIAGLAAAVAGGADRLEVCSALQLGGLTPSLALVDRAVGSGLPVHAMVRPRAGGFCYDAEEIDLMVAEIAALRAHGVAGVVFGTLEDSGELDRATLARLRDAAAGLVAVLHRAVDLTSNPVAGIEVAYQLGFEGILSSGGAVDAMDGLDSLGEMVRTAAGRLMVIAGSGITADNVRVVMEATGVGAVHGSASRPVEERHARSAALGFGMDGRRTTDLNSVAALVAAAHQQIL